MQVIRLAVMISAKTNAKGMAVQKTLSRKPCLFNSIDLTTDDEVYVGNAFAVSKTLQLFLQCLQQFFFRYDSFFLSVGVDKSFSLCGADG